MNNRSRADLGSRDEGAMLDSAGNGNVSWIHSAFRTSTLNFVMLALIVFHGAVFGSNIMDPLSSFNPIDNTTRDKTVLSLFKKIAPMQKLRGGCLHYQGRTGD